MHTLSTVDSTKNPYLNYELEVPFNIDLENEKYKRLKLLHHKNY